MKRPAWVAGRLRDLDRTCRRRWSASRGAARESLAANQALIAGTTVDTNPEVAAAKAKLDQARLDLERTIIRTNPSTMYWICFLIRAERDFTLDIL